MDVDMTKIIMTIVICLTVAFIGTNGGNKK